MYTEQKNQISATLMLKWQLHRSENMSDFEAECVQADKFKLQIQRKIVTVILISETNNV